MEGSGSEWRSLDNILASNFDCDRPPLTQYIIVIILIVRVAGENKW